jgi:hypothetical protein
MGGGLSQLAGQERQIGIIDFYGLKQVSPAQLREALTFKQGDAISFPGDDRFPESEERLSKVPARRMPHSERWPRKFSATPMTSRPSWMIWSTQ